MLDKILSAIGRFSYRFRYLIASLFLVLLVCVAIVQSFASISYSYADYNKVIDVFPQDDNLVIVYENKDEEKISEIANFLSKNEHVTSIQSYITTLGLQMGTAELSSVTGIDESFVKVLFYIKENGTATSGMSLAYFINFIASEQFMSNKMLSGIIDESTKAQLVQAKDLVNKIVADEKFDAETLSQLLGLDTMVVNGIFFMSGVQEMSLEAFVNTMLGLAMQTPNAVSQEQLAMLQQASALIALAKNPQPMQPEQLVASIPVQIDLLNVNTVTLICLMNESLSYDTTGKTVALYDFFCFVKESVLTNEAFSPFFDEATKAQLLGAVQQMEDGRSQLIGTEHSRMVLTIDYEFETKEIHDFYSSLENELNNKLSGSYYLVGKSAMSNELSKTFQGEYLMISIITAVAIFLVVCITFKKILVSAMLICIIECAVFVTMSVMTIGNISMYFIALIIVQCILMGAMVDYGILLSNYYIEVRKDYGVSEALPEVLKRSLRAIGTSALILIIITFCCGFIMTGAVASILVTLCVGSFSALLLVVFALPSLLAIFDKFIIKNKKV